LKDRSSHPGFGISSVGAVQMAVETLEAAWILALTNNQETLLVSTIRIAADCNCNSLLIFPKTMTRLILLGKSPGCLKRERKEQKTNVIK
jgi:hypothetical protein